MTTLKLAADISCLTISAAGVCELRLPMPADDTDATRGMLLATLIMLEAKRLTQLADAELEGRLSSHETLFHEANALIDSAQKHLTEGLADLQRAFVALKR